MAPSRVAPPGSFLPGSDVTVEWTSAGTMLRSPKGDLEGIGDAWEKYQRAHQTGMALGVTALARATTSTALLEDAVGAAVGDVLLVRFYWNKAADVVGVQCESTGGLADRASNAFRKFWLIDKERFGASNVAKWRRIALMNRLT